MSDTRRSFSPEAYYREGSITHAAVNPGCPYAGSWAAKRPFRSVKHDHRDGQDHEHYLLRSTPGNSAGNWWPYSNAWSKTTWTRKERRLTRRAIERALYELEVCTGCPVCEVGRGEECQKCEYERLQTEAFDLMWDEW